MKHDPNMPGSLRHLTMWPEEEWQNQKVHGKDIKVADMDSALHKLQMNAMKMEPGPVPNNDYWEDVLGHEKPSKSAGAPEMGKKASLPAARSTSQSNGTPAPAETDRARPSRGRKRHYDDSSFAGYGEGYADDDDDVAFYSNAESVGKKKRKKVRGIRCVTISVQLAHLGPGSCFKSVDSLAGQRRELRGWHVWGRSPVTCQFEGQKRFHCMHRFEILALARVHEARCS